MNQLPRDELVHCCGAMTGYDYFLAQAAFNAFLITREPVKILEF